MTARLAVLGGSGLEALEGLEAQRRLSGRTTPYGKASAETLLGRWGAREVLFLPRHGSGRRLPPHRINYRANLWLLREQGAAWVVAINAVGGIDAAMGPGCLVIPDQIIDYSWGREHSFHEGKNRDPGTMHVDFTWPYDEPLRQALGQAAAAAGVPVKAGGVYGATQGPRLESAAEIRRLRQDGCHLVGMTGMPEAGLARELALPYACFAVVSNWAAGLGGSERLEQAAILATLERTMRQVPPVLRCLAELL